MTQRQSSISLLITYPLDSQNDVYMFNDCHVMYKTEAQIKSYV